MHAYAYESKVLPSCPVETQPALTPAEQGKLSGAVSKRAKGKRGPAKPAKVEGDSEDNDAAGCDGDDGDDVHDSDADSSGGTKTKAKQANKEDAGKASTKPPKSGKPSAAKSKASKKKEPPAAEESAKPETKAKRAKKGVEDPSPEEAERLRKSRKSCAYHKAKKEVEKQGLSAEEIKAAAKKETCVAIVHCEHVRSS